MLESSFFKEAIMEIVITKKVNMFQYTQCGRKA